jgi:hypothetical protein
LVSRSRKIIEFRHRTISLDRRRQTCPLYRLVSNRTAHCLLKRREYEFSACLWKPGITNLQRSLLLRTEAICLLTLRGQPQERSQTMARALPTQLNRVDGDSFSRFHHFMAIVFLGGHTTVPRRRPSHEQIHSKISSVNRVAYRKTAKKTVPGLDSFLHFIHSPLTGLFEQ